MDDVRRSEIIDMGFDPDKVYYHGTISPHKFDSFKHQNGDIGFHFGTLEQAKQRLKDKMANPHARILAVHLRLKNPLRMRDLSHFSKEAIRYELEMHPKVYGNTQKEKELDRVNTDDDMRKFIKSLGHDGIVYRNEKEVPEADGHLKKAQEHLDQFIKETGANPRKLTPEQKQHPLYKEHMKETLRAEHMINHFAQDSYIVFDPNQVRSIDAKFDKNKSDSGNMTESFYDQLLKVCLGS